MSHTPEDGQPSIRPLEREEPAPIPSPDKPDARHHNIRGTGIPRVTTTTPEPAFSQPQASHNPLEVFHGPDTFVSPLALDASAGKGRTTSGEGADHGGSKDTHL